MIKKVLKGAVNYAVKPLAALTGGKLGLQFGAPIVAAGAKALASIPVVGPLVAKVPGSVRAVVAQGSLAALGAAGLCGAYMGADYAQKKLGLK